MLDFVEVAEEEEADTGRTATVGISPRLRGLQNIKDHKIKKHTRITRRVSGRLSDISSF